MTADTQDISVIAIHHQENMKNGSVNSEYAARIGKPGAVPDVRRLRSRKHRRSATRLFL